MLLNGLLQRVMAVALVLSCCLCAGRTHACVGYDAFVPISPDIQDRCATCHGTPPNIPNGIVSSPPRNPFGQAWCQTCLGTTVPTDCSIDFRSGGRCPVGGNLPNPPPWDTCSQLRLSFDSPLFGLEDADGDGFTNQQEFNLASNPGQPDGADECADDPCDNLAPGCVDPNQLVGGDFQCTCRPGYQGDGRRQGSGCTDLNECAADTSPCLDENSDCVNRPGSFDCPCNQDDGYVGSGRADGGCTLENLCDANPCSALSICFPRVGGFDCRACAAGFTGDVSTCSACPPGYSGDGVGAQGCSDVNECTASNDCAPGVSCANRVGGRTCQSCPVGSTGTAVGPEGCARNVCAECSPYASCDPQRNPACVCNLGFTGPTGSEGRICEDVNECERGLANCGPNSTCRNVVGSYLCACNEGYTAQGDQCVPATCASWGQSCGDNGSCDDAGGRPQCICAAELSGTYPNCVASKGLGPEGSRADGSGYSPRSNVMLAAQSSGCAFTPDRSPALAWVPAGLLLGVASWRRKRARRRSARSLPRPSWGAVGLYLLCGVLAACGDSDKGGPAAPSTGGTYGNAAAGVGGSSGTAGTGGQGGSAGAEAVPAGGNAGASPQAAVGAAPNVFTCKHSRECAVDQWCNPATSACDPRSVEGETLTFRGQVFGIVQTIGCPRCHTPGKQGDLDVSGSGANLLFNELQRGYSSLVAGGVNCQGGPKRLCVDDPASSRLIRQVMAGQGGSQESIAFTDWSEPLLQTILRWIASGAPRDVLCGNFVRDPGEACDEGPTPATLCGYGVASCTLCNASCQLVSAGAGPSCGDGVLDLAHETCDPASLVSQESGPFGNAVCGPDCTFVAP